MLYYNDEIEDFNDVAHFFLWLLDEDEDFWEELEDILGDDAWEGLNKVFVDWKNEEYE